jgi:predicted Holliday junction resolvase-like endonuclease
MKVVVLILSLMFSTVAFSQSKADMQKMLQQFKAQGMFSEEQLKAAQAQLNQMSDQDLEALKSQAKEKLNDPKVQEDIKRFQQSQKK